MNSNSAVPAEYEPRATRLGPVSPRLSHVDRPSGSGQGLVVPARRLRRRASSRRAIRSRMVTRSCSLAGMPGQGVSARRVSIWTTLRSRRAALCSSACSSAWRRRTMSRRSPGAL